MPTEASAKVPNEFVDGPAVLRVIQALRHDSLEAKTVDVEVQSFIGSSNYNINTHIVITIFI